MTKKQNKTKSVLESQQSKQVEKIDCYSRFADGDIQAVSLEDEHEFLEQLGVNTASQYFD